MGCSYLGWKLVGWEFSWVEIFWVGNVQEGIVQAGVILGENFPSGISPGRSYPGWEFSLVEVLWEDILSWESSGWQFSRLKFSSYLLMTKV